MLALTYCFSFLGRGGRLQNPRSDLAMLRPCKSIFPFGVAFLCSWPSFACLFGVFCPCRSYFLLFITTLQRGGTRAAHGIESQNRNLGVASFLLSPPWSDLNLDVSKDSVLEGSGLDFGGLEPRFWSLRASILEVPGLLVEREKRILGRSTLNAPKCKLWAWGLEDSGPQF